MVGRPSPTPLSLSPPQLHFPCWPWQVWLHAAAVANRLWRAKPPSGYSTICPDRPQVRALNNFKWGNQAPHRATALGFIPMGGNFYSANHFYRSTPVDKIIVDICLTQFADTGTHFSEQTKYVTNDNMLCATVLSRMMQA